MKIAMGVRYFRAVGGAEKVTRNLASHLAEAGHEVHVYAFEGDQHAGVSVHLLHKPALVPRAMRDWATGREIARALSTSGAEVTFGEQKTWGADVIRPGGGVEDMYWQARADYARLLKSSSARFLFPKRYFDVRAEANGYGHPRLRRVIANSRMMRNDLERAYPQLKGRITVIYNGVDAVRPPAADRPSVRIDICRKHNLEVPDVLLLFVGHEFKRKGLRHAIGALARARAAGVNARMLVIGRDRAAPYERECARQGLASDVAFAGSVSGVNQYYAAADALALPSHYDPFANVTIEAFGAGLPVITSRRNGGSELVDASAGWVIEHPSDEDGIARAIAELSDTARRQVMGEAARAIAGNHLLKDKMRELEDVLLAVAAEKKGGL